jgi:hypothetical protein
VGKNRVKYLILNAIRIVEDSMGVLKFILRLLGWLITILLQIAASYFVIFILSVIFAGVDKTTRAGWLATLVGIWFGYVVGVTLVGLAALRWLWKVEHLLPVQRLLGTAIGALIPLLILLPIGFSVPVGGFGTSFYDVVTNNWQPILAQASIFAAVVGFYVPGMLNIGSPASK